MTNPPASPPEDARPRDHGAPVPKAARDRTVDLLGEHFARDHLTIEDFERRLNLALEADSTRALDALVADLPAVALPAAPASTGAEAQQPLRPLAHPAQIKEVERMTGIFGEIKRRGRWTPARDTTLSLAMGSAVLDFREAVFAPGESRILVQAFFGSVEIIAPPGLAVECGGSAVFGEFQQRQDEPAAADPDSPRLRIEGLCVFGSVEIETRLAGESKRGARRRRRKEGSDRRLTRAVVASPRRRLRLGSDFPPTA